MASAICSALSAEKPCSFAATQNLAYFQKSAVIQQGSWPFGADTLIQVFVLERIWQVFITYDVRVGFEP